MLQEDEYKAIADRAIAVLGELNPDRFMEAWEIMVLETEVIQKPEARYNEVDIMRELGMMSGGALLDKLEAALPARVVRAIENDGIDLAHPETQAVLGQLRDGSVITPDERDALIGLSHETVYTYPSKSQTKLRPGEVQNALQWRESGELP